MPVLAVFVGNFVPTFINLINLCTGSCYPWAVWSDYYSSHMELQCSLLGKCWSVSDLLGAESVDFWLSSILVLASSRMSSLFFGQLSWFGQFSRLCSRKGGGGPLPTISCLKQSLSISSPLDDKSLGFSFSWDFARFRICITTFEQIVWTAYESINPPQDYLWVNLTVRNSNAYWGCKG